MKILHTSDWHIGRALYGRKRYEECEKFLNWLVGLIESENIDVLLARATCSHTSTPSNHAQQVYLGSWAGWRRPKTATWWQSQEP